MPRRLYDLAFGRSGDKGDIANISVIAVRRKRTGNQGQADRRTGQRTWVISSKARSFVMSLDNIEALNFSHNALDGGGRALRIDALGNAGYAAI
jgi:hypothetical protein